jgi:hypothetical protein
VNPFGIDETHGAIGLLSRREPARPNLPKIPSGFNAHQGMVRFPNRLELASGKRNIAHKIAYTFHPTAAVPNVDTPELFAEDIELQ